MRVLVLSDTHIPDFAKRLPEGLVGELRRADAIVHAGDVTSSSVLDELAQYAPTHVAMGNGDGPDVAAWGAREDLDLTIGGVPVAVVHISGPANGRRRRLGRRFPGARVAVFGHSHIPWNEDEDGLLLFNPGSPTWKRRQPRATFGILDLADGQVVEALVVELR
jgi:putative phosphoesterase